AFVLELIADVVNEFAVLPDAQEPRDRPLAEPECERLEIRERRDLLLGPALAADLLGVRDLDHLTEVEPVARNCEAPPADVDRRARIRVDRFEVREARPLDAGELRRIEQRADGQADLQAVERAGRSADEEPGDAPDDAGDELLRITHRPRRVSATRCASTSPIGRDRRARTRRACGTRG